MFIVKQTEDKSIHIFDKQTGEKLRTLPGHSYGSLGKHKDRIQRQDDDDHGDAEDEEHGTLFSETSFDASEVPDEPLISRLTEVTSGEEDEQGDGKRDEEKGQFLRDLDIIAVKRKEPKDHLFFEEGEDCRQEQENRPIDAFNESIPEMEVASKDPLNGDVSQIFHYIHEKRKCFLKIKNRKEKVGFPLSSAIGKKILDLHPFLRRAPNVEMDSSEAWTPTYEMYCKPIEDTEKASSDDTPTLSPGSSLCPSYLSVTRSGRSIRRNDNELETEDGKKYSHSYSFNRWQRLEKETGLNKRARKLKESCTPCKVFLSPIKPCDSCQTWSCRCCLLSEFSVTSDLEVSETSDREVSMTSDLEDNEDETGVYSQGSFFADNKDEHLYCAVDEETFYSSEDPFQTYLIKGSLENAIISSENKKENHRKRHLNDEEAFITSNMKKVKKSPGFRRKLFAEKETTSLPLVE